MKTKILMAALLASLVATAGAVQAQSERERPDFATLDLNGDGALTLEEMQAQGEARFAVTDANGDGALSVEELIVTANERSAGRVGQMIERLDANDDGALQPDEMPTRGGGRLERMFDRVDADDNGAISEEEFEIAKERRGNRDRG